MEQGLGDLAGARKVQVPYPRLGGVTHGSAMPVPPTDLSPALSPRRWSEETKPGKCSWDEITLAVFRLPKCLSPQLC